MLLIKQMASKVFDGVFCFLSFGFLSISVYLSIYISLYFKPICLLCFAFFMLCFSFNNFFFSFRLFFNFSFGLSEDDAYVDKLPTFERHFDSFAGIVTIHLWEQRGGQGWKEGRVLICGSSPS